VCKLGRPEQGFFPDAIFAGGLAGGRYRGWSYWRLEGDWRAVDGAVIDITARLVLHVPIPKGFSRKESVGYKGWILMSNLRK